MYPQDADDLLFGELRFLHAFPPRRRNCNFGVFAFGGQTNLAVIPLISYGTIAEAFEFLSHSHISSKVRVFGASEHKGGFAFRAASEKGQLTQERLFSITKLRDGDPQLLDAIWREADLERTAKFAKVRVGHT